MRHAGKIGRAGSYFLSGLSSYFAKLKTATGRLKNIEGVRQAYRSAAGLGHVKRARADSIALAEIQYSSPAVAQNAIDVQVLGSYQGYSVSSRICKMNAGLAAKSSVSVFSSDRCGLHRCCRHHRGPAAFSLLNGRARNAEMASVASKHQIQKRPLTPPIIRPVSIVAHTSCLLMILKNGIRNRGVNRWVVTTSNADVILRPPSMKADLVLPRKAPPAPFALPDAVMDNRWLGVSNEVNKNGLVSYSVWDLERNLVKARIFEKGLRDARILNPATLSTVSQIDGQPAYFKTWDVNTSRERNRIALEAGKVLNTYAAGSRTIVVIKTIDQKLRAYVMSGLNNAAGLTPEPIPDLFTSEPLPETLTTSNDGAWIAFARGPVISTYNFNSKMRARIEIPAARLSLLTITNDARLVFSADETKFYSQSLQGTPPSDPLPALEGQFLVASPDGQTAYLQSHGQIWARKTALVESGKATITKAVCKADCFKDVKVERARFRRMDFALYREPGDKSGGGSEPRALILDLATGEGYSPVIDEKKAFTQVAAGPPAADLESCLTYTAGCLTAGRDALRTKDGPRAYAYLYGACRGGEFDACADIAKNAEILHISTDVGKSFADFGCGLGDENSCRARAPASNTGPPSPPAATPLPSK